VLARNGHRIWSFGLIGLYTIGTLWTILTLLT
jgi:hypothetical protein